MIRGTCRFCGRVYRVDERYAGRTGKCKTCGAEVTVPGEPVPIDDGLPPGSGPAAAAPEPTPPRAPRRRGHVLIQSVDAGAPIREQPETTAAAPAEEPQAWSSHDSRARFEPEEGPTALGGAWLDDEADADSEEEDDAPHAALATDYLLTDVTPDEDFGRPRILVVASLALILLAVSFCIYFFWSSPARSRPLAGVIGGMIVLLAGLGFIRLWIERWDGLIPGLLSCLGVLTIVVLSAMPRADQASRVTPEGALFLLGALVVMTLLCLCAFRESCRDYFAA